MTRNYVELIGFAGQGPKRIGNGDHAPVKLWLPTTERWKDSSGERQERTEWHTVLFWGRLAEIAAKHIHKGSRVLVTGSLKSRQYENDEGQRCTVWEIHARELVLLDSKNRVVEDSGEPTPEPKPTPAPKPSASPTTLALAPRAAGIG